MESTLDNFKAKAFAKAKERPEIVYLWGGLAEAWNMFGERVYRGSESGLVIPDGCCVIRGERGRDAVLQACQGRLF
jgi:hypothetical protein